MRKIINSTYITLDGAVEDPHLWPSLGDSAKSVSYEIQMDLLDSCDVILMGRRTYESFAGAWPTRSGDRMADSINAMEKQVVSTTLRNPVWNNAHVIESDGVEKIRLLKNQPGKDIVQYGIGELTFGLLGDGLIDELRLWVHPLILGQNGPKKSHFLDCPPVQLELVDSRVLTNGVVIMRYKPN